MIDELYAIAVKPAEGLIVATLTGLWNRETIDRYKIALLAAGAQLMAAGVEPQQIGILIDTTGFSPQAQDVVAYYIQAFSEPRFQSDRIAVVYGSTLQKMQTRRMAIGTPRFFEQIDQALRWLRSLETVESGPVVFP